MRDHWNSGRIRRRRPDSPQGPSGDRSAENEKSKHRPARALERRQLLNTGEAADSASGLQSAPVNQVNSQEPLAVTGMATSEPAAAAKPKATTISAPGLQRSPRGVNRR